MVKLLAEEHEAIRQDIRRGYLKSSEPQDKPRAILIAGQPGAGKGRLATEAIAQFEDGGGAVHIDPDRLRDRHRGYPQYLREDDKSAAEKVHEDASQWAKELRQDAIEGRRNIVLDATLNDKVKARELAEQLRASGYEIEVRALAVHERESRQGIYRRYENAKEKGVPARWVPDTAHDQAYQGMPIALGHLERNRLVDKISIQRRDGTVIYENDQVGKGESGGSQIALLADRARKLTEQEKRDYAHGWDKVEEQMKSRGAGELTLSKVSGHRNEAYKELQQEERPEAAARHVTVPEWRRQQSWQER